MFLVFHCVFVNRDSSINCRSGVSLLRTELIVFIDLYFHIFIYLNICNFWRMAINFSYGIYQLRLYRNLRKEKLSCLY